MLSELGRVRTRFVLLSLTGLLLGPAAGLAAAQLYGLVIATQLLAPAHGLLPFLCLACFITLATYKFFNYFNPLRNTLRSGKAPVMSERQQLRLAHFGRLYWGVLFGYAVLMPLALAGGVPVPLLTDSTQLLQFMLLQLVAVTLAGLPAYQLALDLVGALAARFNLQQVQISLTSRLLLIGAFVPLLSYTVLMNQHWQQSGSLSPGHMSIWLALVCISAVITLFSVRSFSRSLAPIQQLLERSGATRHAELGLIAPQSADEIGGVTRVMGRLFTRLGEQESHMRAVVETAAEGIIVVDGDGLIDTFNPAAEKLFGYSAGEVQRKPLEKLLPQLLDGAGRLQAHAAEYEVESRHRDGTAMHLSVRLRAMHSGGQHMYTIMVADITRRKHIEQQLRDAENRYRDLVETAHDMVWTMDTAGRLTYINRACTAIYGHEPEYMLQRRWPEFRSPDHPPRDEEAISALLAGEPELQFETVHLDSAGKPHFLVFNARSHRDMQGNVLRLSGTTRDITEQKAFQHQLSYNAEHDPLTGLFNRNYFQEELERTVARVARTGHTCALFYLDLDQFRYINDTVGHAAGDRLLVDMAALLSLHVRDGDLLARFGGDEFTLLLYNIARNDVLNAAENFRALCDEYRFSTNGGSYNITCSVGITMIDPTVSSAEEVLSHADLACNVAKQQGRNRVNLYDPSVLNKADMAADMSWATQVRDMLENDRFRLVYQPIVSTRSGEILDYEVLVRMVCDDGQTILPGGFMPAAERFGLIHSVDRWIVARAIRQLADLHIDGHTTRFSINLSGKAFEDASLLPLIRELLDETGLDPSFVTFEITETAAIANLAEAEEFISALKDIGCQFALDDFGSGFSSFAYLKHLPVDKLKIDGTFVKGMAHSAVDQAMVESMNQVAHALGKLTVAECVENDETLTILREIGVDRAQGNHIGAPNGIPVGRHASGSVDSLMLPG